MTNGSAPGNGSPEQDARLELRVSHADRDRVVETLTAAASEGLLAADELDDRVEAALSARTRGELAMLTADLPPSGIERQAKDLIRIDQRFGDVTRAGHWVVPRRMEIKLTAGDVTLDFTRALIIHDTVRIDVDLGFGGDLTLGYQAWHSHRYRRLDGAARRRQGPSCAGSACAGLLADGTSRPRSRRRRCGAVPETDVLAVAAPQAPAIPAATLSGGRGYGHAAVLRWPIAAGGRLVR